MKRKIFILWTGGWDSTFRIIELSRREVEVQPIYVVDDARRSVSYEKKAIHDILELLKTKAETNADFLPVIYINKIDIPKNADITKAYQLFKDEADMGSQHDWLARLACQYPGMELCIEKALGDHAPIRKSIHRHGNLLNTGDGYIVDKDTSSDELNLVLGNLKLPIFDKTELDMQRIIKEWGYEDVMSHIWFCHSPINGKPCGLCSPCTTKMTSKMEYLLPESAQKRNIRLRSIEKHCGKIAAKIYRHISRRLA